jgi:hypothetical protein
MAGFASLPGTDLSLARRHLMVFDNTGPTLKRATRNKASKREPTLAACATVGARLSKRRAKSERAIRGERSETPPSRA